MLVVIAVGTVTARRDARVSIIRPVNTKSQLRIVPLLAIALSVQTLVAQAPRPQPRPASSYFPDRFQWEQRTPDQAGMDGAALDAAMKFASANENPATKIGRAHV